MDVLVDLSDLETVLKLERPIRDSATELKIKQYLKLLPNLVANNTPNTAEKIMSLLNMKFDEVCSARKDFIKKITNSEIKDSGEVVITITHNNEKKTRVIRNEGGAGALLKSLLKINENQDGYYIALSFISHPPVYLVASIAVALSQDVTQS